MAKQDQSLSGKIGPVVTYVLNGQPVVRSLPGPYEQTPATKARSSNFGKATRAAALLRSGLQNVLPFPKDYRVQGRLTGVISKWLGTTPITEVSREKKIPYLIDFHFNSKSELNSLWKSLLQVDLSEQGELLLNIPPFVPANTIYAPSWAQTIECRIGAACCNLADGSFRGQFFKSIHFPRDRQEVVAQQVPLPVPVETGNIVLVVVSMVYTITKSGIELANTKPAFLPADVIAAMYF
jgi:hypothetical protein